MGNNQTNSWVGSGTYLMALFWHPADSKYVFQTEKGTPFIFTGTGTGGWEAALTNTLSPGDKVVTFR